VPRVAQGAPLARGVASGPGTGGKDSAGWKAWLRRIEDSWQPKPLTVDLDEYYEEEIMIKGEAQT